MGLKAAGITGRARVANWNGKAWSIANLPALDAGRAGVWDGKTWKQAAVL
jgi:hypothetical protein